MQLKTTVEHSVPFAKLFSQVYLEAPDAALLRELREIPLKNMWGFPLDKESEIAFLNIEASLQASPEDHSQSLVEDHLLLFIGLGMPLAPPWGSVYLHEENLLQRGSTIKFGKFLEDCDLVYVRSERQPLDHLGICLSALSVLLERQGNPDSLIADQAGKDIGILLSEHMIPWTGRCLQLARERAATPFYSAIAVLTNSLLLQLLELFGSTAAERKLYY